MRRSSILNPEIKKGEELIALQAKLSNFPDRDDWIPGEIFAMHIEDRSNLREYIDPMAFKASSNPDIMYLHEAMQQQDRKELVDAIEKDAVLQVWLVDNKIKC